VVSTVLAPIAGQLGELTKKFSTEASSKDEMTAAKQLADFVENALCKP
jgi:hypothetical protein